MESFYLPTLIRLIAPLSILKWPLFGILFTSLVDMYDWQFVTLKTDADYNFYQNWDKLLDLYYWLFAILIVLKWKDLKARLVAISLFLLRVAGMLIFWVTQNRQALFYFPNIFENFFIFYLAYNFFSKETHLLKTKGTALVILLSLLIPKLVHEYFMHYLGLQPWQMWNYGAKLGFSGFWEEYTNYFIWGSIFHILPITVLIICIKRKGRLFV